MGPSFRRRARSSSYRAELLRVEVRNRHAGLRPIAQPIQGSRARGSRTSPAKADPRRVGKSRERDPARDAGAGGLALMHAPLLKVAPLATDRVQPFVGERPYMATGDLDDQSDVRITPVTYDARPSRADLTVRPGDVCFARMAATRKVL